MSTASENGPLRLPNLKEVRQGDKTEKIDEEVALCRCGQTKDPTSRCDGSHEKVGFKAPEKELDLGDDAIITVVPRGPYKVSSESKGNKVLCRCGLSKNKPFCDGSHKNWKKEGKAPDVADIEDLGGRGKGDDPNLPPNTKEEPWLQYVKALARDGLESHHGAVGAMGVRHDLPVWSDIQIMVSQLANKPLMDDVDVDTSVTIGPRAKKPLRLEIPLFVSDMSFGAISIPAKIALSKGAEMAGTGIASGEGGMLSEEQEQNSRYFYEYASGGFGWDIEKVKHGVGAFHFKGGQGAKTGTGGHLPGNKVTKEIAKVRDLKEGEDAISPATFPNLSSSADFKKMADQVREASGGIPIGFKLSANHIEADIQFALDASADYIIIDGRGGATGAAPLIFRDNISVPTIPALARARAYLDKVGAKDVTLIITGGLRTPDDFVKALCLGADAIAVANSALHSIGCIAARTCNTNTCPAGIATQDPNLTSLLDVEKGAKQLNNFLRASSHLIAVMARACSHSKVSEFSQHDISTWKREMADLTGIEYSGLGVRK